MKSFIKRNISVIEIQNTAVNHITKGRTLHSLSNMICSYRSVVVIITAQLYSTKPEFKFCAGSYPAHGVSEIRDGEDLWQWSPLEIRLNALKNNSSSSSVGLLEKLHSIKISRKVLFLKMENTKKLHIALYKNSFSNYLLWLSKTNENNNM